MVVYEKIYLEVYKIFYRSAILLPTYKNSFECLSEIDTSLVKWICSRTIPIYVDTLYQNILLTGHSTWQIRN